jgi:hypothetical protein
MAFKNIEQVNEIKYEGYQFVDKDGCIYSATFGSKVRAIANREYVTDITSDKDESNPVRIYTKDIPKMIKVLQAVYDKYVEDNSKEK